MLSVNESRGLVLVVEDEPAIAESLGMFLRREGFGVQIENDGLLALAAIRKVHPVAVLLDIGLPSMDGIALCKELRAGGDWTPIIFLTARDDEIDKILGLEIGADDYIVKNATKHQVMARLKAVLRRSSGMPLGTGALTIGDITVNPETRVATVNETPVALTATEFDLLAFLMSKPGRVFSRDELISHVWGYASMGTRTVDVHVAQLRAKFGQADPIRTVRGVGYAVDKA
ncbi:MAG: response regulator transcription factor [Actinomycetes bacterium]